MTYPIMTADYALHISEGEIVNILDSETGQMVPFTCHMFDSTLADGPSAKIYFTSLDSRKAQYMAEYGTDYSDESDIAYRAMIKHVRHPSGAAALPRTEFQTMFAMMAYEIG